MSLDRHGCKLQLDSLAEACNHEVIFLLFSSMDNPVLNHFCQNLTD